VTVFESHCDLNGWIYCPWCGQYIAIEVSHDRGKIVAQHTDSYPTRVCEGSNRRCSTAFGTVLIGERE